MRRLIYALAALALTCKVDAQRSASAIYQNIKSLNVFARILFVTMEPGDEDAQLMAYLSSHAHCKVGLLCLTRGEKMPNYSGYEKGVDLGIIHALELAKAGTTAGFEPMGTCAMDLGNYGSAKDIFNVWKEDLLISGLVWAIRYFRPDIIITPYNKGKDSGRSILTSWIIEANKRATDKNYNAIQLAGLFPFLDTAAAKQIYWDVPDSVQQERDGDISIATNQVDDASGLPYKEIARQSYLCERSIFKNLKKLPQRKDTQYLQPLLSASKDLFGHIDTSWTRSGANFQPDVDSAVLQYDFVHPERSIAALTGLYTKISQSGMTGFWKNIKLGQLQDIILSCAGISVKAACDKPFGIIGQNYTISVDIRSNRSPVTIKSIVIGDSTHMTDTTLEAKNNYLLESTIHIPFSKDAYQPFWLNKTIDGKHQMYTIDDAMTNNLTDTACYSATIVITLNHVALTIKTPLVYNTFDRMNGVLNEPFYTIEPVQVSQKPLVLLTKVTGDTKENKNTDVTLKFSPLFDGSMFTILQILQPGGVSLKQGQTGVTGQPEILYKSDSIINFRKNDIFKINVPFNPVIKATTLMPSVLMNFSEGGQDFDANIKQFSYPYLPFILYNYHDQTKIVSGPVKTKGRRVAYLFGLTDDNISTALLQLGYKTDLLNMAAVQPDSLKDYDAVIIGSYLPLDQNQDSATFAALKFNLENYVYRGGTLISLTDNNTANGLLPYQVTAAGGELINDAGRDSLASGPDDALFNYPNHIDLQAVAKWEGSLINGLPLQYDTHYRPQLTIVSAKGSSTPLLCAKSGEGSVIYCNLNISSQAMDGQPDAFRLLANFIATRYKNKHAN